MALPILQSQDPVDQFVVAVARTLGKQRHYDFDKLPELSKISELHAAHLIISQIAEPLFNPEERMTAPTSAHVLCNAIAELRERRARDKSGDTQIERARAQELEGLERDVFGVVKWLSGEYGGCITTTLLGGKLAGLVSDLRTERARVQELEMDVRGLVQWITRDGADVTMRTEPGGTLQVYLRNGRLDCRKLWKIRGDIHTLKSMLKGEPQTSEIQTDEVADLASVIDERFGKVNCTYCEWVVPLPERTRTLRGVVRNMLREHVEVCPGHPMRKLEAELEKAKAQQAVSATDTLPVPGMIVARKAGDSATFRVVRYAHGKVDLVPVEGTHCASTYTLDEFYMTFTPATSAALKPEEVQASPRAGDVYVLRDDQEDDALYLVVRVLKSGAVIALRTGGVTLGAPQHFDKSFFRAALRPATPEETKQGRRSALP